MSSAGNNSDVLAERRADGSTMLANTSAIERFPMTEEALRWLEGIVAERFGHQWHLEFCAEGLALWVKGSEGRILFDRLLDCFAEPRSDFPCCWWNAEVEGWISVIGGGLPTPGCNDLMAPVIEKIEDGYVIHYDIFGLTYWMLARVEEIGRTDLDNHERFPATSSHALKHGYLDRPVVDEWLHILGQVIQQYWPALVLKQHEFQMRVSHDVDQPSLYAFKPWKTIARMMAGNILKRWDPKAFLTAPYIKLATRDSLIEADPYNTFDWLMDVSEANGLKSAFYWICGRTHPNKDADYEVEQPVMRDLLRRIHRRGHEIGLHPSYNTFKDSAALKREADRLKRVCAEEGIDQEQWGGRMHYLRWAQPTTMSAWDDAGMSYDSTLGYADNAGFRCGTCHEYAAFDAERLVELRLRIRPLIAMECSVIDTPYMGLGVGSQAKQEFLKLKERCQRVGGCFSLLWHNSSFLKKDMSLIYKETLS